MSLAFPRFVSRRRLFWIVYGTLALAALAVAVVARARLPQMPLIDPDTWGYLHPALSRLGGGPFQHTYGRDFLYPGFVYAVLRVCGDFRALGATQHALGVATGVLMVLAWERLGRLLHAGRPPSGAARLLGLLAAAAYVDAPSAQFLEHCIRPEAIFPFFALLSIFLNLEFIACRWSSARPRPGAAAWLGGAAVFVSAVLYFLKPAFGFAVGVANAPLLVSLARPGMTAWRKAAMAAGGVGASVLLLAWPEHRFRADDPATALFLPNTLLTVHADQIRDQIAADLAKGQPVPYDRAWLGTLRDRLSVLLTEAARPANRPYRSLGFNPDYLLYTDYVFRDLAPHASRGGDDFTAAVSLYYYRRAVLHHPARMLGKIARQLNIFYRLDQPFPPRLLDTRGGKEARLDRFYADNVQHLERPRYEQSAALYPPVGALAEASRRLAGRPAKISHLAGLGLVQNLLVGFYTPVLLACAVAAAAALARGSRRWLAAAAVVGLVYGYNFGNSLTVAVVHSLDVGRYVANQLAFTLFSAAGGLCFLGAVAGAAWRWATAAKPSEPLAADGLPDPAALAAAPGPEPSLCVLIPCYNEAPSIAGVVGEYRGAFPAARILVVDNASTDGTAGVAAGAGAEVWLETRRGKASAVLSALGEIDSDLVLMVDGDGSYPAEGGARLVRAWREHPADLLTGIRCPVEGDGGGAKENGGGGGQQAGPVFRPLHQGGTRLFGRVHRLVFGFEPADLFSGLRLFSRRYYQNVPILSRGFELELELTAQAIDKGFSMRELPVPFGARTAGTASKLRTVRDGLRILRFLVVLARDYRPLGFFGALGGGVVGLSLLAGFLPVWEFLRTHYVSHVPLAILAASLMVLAFLCFHAGITLESGLRYNRENYQQRIRQATYQARRGRS